MMKDLYLRLGNRRLVAIIAAMLESVNRVESEAKPVSTIQAISSSLRLNEFSSSTADEVDSNVR